MALQNFCLPKGIHLAIDDMGWLYGRDQRDQGLPSRTGGEISVCRRQDEFVNYRIRRERGVSKIVIK